MPNGRDLGVMPVSAVVLMIRKGLIGRDTLLQRVGSSKWRPAEQVATAVFDALRRERAAKANSSNSMEGGANSRSRASAADHAGMPPPLPGGSADRDANEEPRSPAEPVDFLDDPSTLDVDLTDPYAPGIEAADAPNFNPLAAAMSVAVPAAIPPPVPAWAHVQTAVSAGPQRGEREEERAVPAGFVILAWVTAAALLLDIVWGLVSSIAYWQQNIDFLSNFGPKAGAVVIIALLPSPFLSLIPGAIVVGWVISKLPWHAQPHPPSVGVVRWLMLTVAPLAAIVVILVVPRDWIRPSYVIGAVALGVTQWGAAVPWTITGAINERIRQRKWRIWPWAGPLAGGLMGASCLTMVGANVYLCFAATGNVAGTQAERVMGVGLVALLAVLGIGLRVLGMVITAIWIVQLAIKLSKVPLVALESRD